MLGLALSKGIPQAIANVSNIQSLQERAKRLRMEEEMQPLKIEEQSQTNQINAFNIKKAKEQDAFDNSPVDLNFEPVVRGMTAEVKKTWMDYGQSQGLVDENGMTTQGKKRKLLGNIESDTKIFKTFIDDTVLTPMKQKLDTAYGEWQKAQEKDPAGEKTAELGNQYMTLYGQYQQTLGKVEEGAKAVTLNQTYQKIVKDGTLAAIQQENPQVANALEIAFQNKDQTQINKILDEFAKAKTSGKEISGGNDVDNFLGTRFQGFYTDEKVRANAFNWLATAAGKKAWEEEQKRLLKQKQEFATPYNIIVPTAEGLVPFDARKGRLGEPTGIGKPLTGEMITTGQQINTLKETFDRVNTLYKKEYVGPIQGRTGGLKEKTVGLKAEQAQFYSDLEQTKNSLIYLMSGKQINESEFKRLMAQLPDRNLPSGVFEARMKNFKMTLDSILKNREKNLGGYGTKAKTDSLGIR